MKNRQPNGFLEVTSALLTPAALVGFIRIFDEANAVIPLMATALFSTLVAVALRRLKMPLPVSALISFVIFLLFAMNRFAADTLQLGFLPTGDTIAVGQSLWHELTAGFEELVAPVPASDSFLLPSMAVAWAMAFLTDWGALRLRLAFEPVLPASLIFVFSTFLGIRSDEARGTNDHSLTVAAIFVIAVILWTIAQRAANLGENNVWLAGQRTKGATAVAAGGAILGSVAIIAGILLAPAIPGANGEPRVELNEGAKPARDVESPIVDIERQLGPEQREDVIFTVRADSPRYWRSAGLDTYQGNKWIIEGKFKNAGDGKDLSGDTSDTETKATVKQTFELSAATNIWVPAAFEPVKVSDQNKKITWNEGSDSLTVSNDVPTTDGLTYTVESDAPLFSAEQLRAADASVPDEIATKYLKLPTIPDSVTSEAQTITASATTRYDQMIALQTYFRNFDYSLERPPPEPGLDPLDNFLLQRIGFCQQFAGTFAVMARALGHPARVATGYTWGAAGEEDPEGFRTYTVRGRQAHAWPEVYFGDLGWVIFEPTPGRGAPEAEHTGVSAIQDIATGGGETLPNPPDTTPVEPEAAANTPETTIPPAGTPEGANSDGNGTDASSRNFPTPPLWVWLPTLLILAYVAAIPTVRRFRKQRRLQVASAASTPSHVSAAIAWNEVQDALGFCFAITRRSSETKTEFARRLEPDNKVDHEALKSLATLNTRANYHPAGLSRTQVQETLQLSERLTKQTYAQLPIWLYWARVLNPIRVLSRIGQTVQTLSADSKHIEQMITSRPT